VRILTFTSLFPNAVQPLHGVFVYQRTAHLARLPGNYVQVVAPTPYFPRGLRWLRWQSFSQVPMREKLGGLDVYHPRYPLVPKVSMPLHGLLMFFGSLSRVLQLHKESQFDCVDAHYVYPDGFAAVLLGKLIGVPVMVSARGTDINLFPSFRPIRSLIRWTLREAAGSVAVCTALKRAMLDLDIPGLDVQVIGNGIDSQRFQPVEDIAARRALGLPEDAQTIVSVGSLIPLKGHQLLITSFAQVADKFHNLMLYIIGEGEYRPALEGLIADLGLGDRVFLVGNRPNEELRFWYSTARLSCLVSSREGWPNVLLESLSCGTPVLATRVGGIPEVITSPDLGVLVEQNCPAIAAGLEFSLKKRWDREALIRHARARTWSVVASEIQNFFDSILFEIDPLRFGGKDQAR
jgi:teichuronic acid biosynthesis glycosyltransferase TuaC